MIKDIRKGKGYIEIMVVVAVLLVITLFAIPRYQNLRRDAYKAKIANDSRLVETYVLTKLTQEGVMPKEYKKISNENLATLVDSKDSYLKGELIKSNDIKAIGGSKYMLPKDEILKSINTKLKGEFIYTDNGVVYIDNVKSVDIEDAIPKVTGTALPEHVLSGQTYANKYNLNLIGTMPNNGQLNKTLTKQGESIKLEKGFYEGGEIKVEMPNLKSSNIKKGVNIGGVRGDLVPGKKMITRYLDLNDPDNKGRSKTTIIPAEGSYVTLHMRAHYHNAEQSYANSWVWDSKGKLVFETDADSYQDMFASFDGRTITYSTVGGYYDYGQAILVYMPK